MMMVVMVVVLMLVVVVVVVVVVKMRRMNFRYMRICLPNKEDNLAYMSTTTSAQCAEDLYHHHHHHNPGKVVHHPQNMNEAFCMKLLFLPQSKQCSVVSLKTNPTI